MFQCFFYITIEKIKLFLLWLKKETRRKANKKETDDSSNNSQEKLIRVSIKAITVTPRKEPLLIYPSPPLPPPPRISSPGNNNIINSTVFKWSRKDKRFQEFQTLPTMGAYDMTYFTVDIGTGNGLNHGLAVANSFDGKSTLIFSDIYRWQDGRWTLFHSLEVGSIFLPF